MCPGKAAAKYFDPFIVGIHSDARHFGRYRSVRHRAQALASYIIDDIENPEPASRCQLIVDEIQAAPLVG